MGVDPGTIGGGAHGTWRPGDRLAGCVKEDI